MADFNDNVMKVGLAGRTLSYRDQELTLHRHGRAEQVWMDLDYSPLLDEGGTPVGVMAVVMETSAKVLAERRLLGERERLAALFEQAPSFMAMLEGPEHRFVLVNPSYVRLVGHRPLLGLTVPQALPDAESQGYVRLMDEVYRTGTAYTDHGARYDSQVLPGGPVVERYVDFVFQPIRAESGEVTGIFIEGVETTARVLAERRREGLARFAEELHRLDDSASVGYAAAFLLGTLLDVSRAGISDEIDDVAETLHVDRDWTAPGVESLAGVLRLRDYGSFVDNLKRNEIDLPASTTCGRTPARRKPRRRSKTRSARSFVNVPVVEQGCLVAVLFVDHAQVRCSTDEELAFVREVAHRARTAVERVKGEAAREAEALARREAQAQISALDQQPPRARHRHVGHGLPDGCAVDRDAPAPGLCSLPARRTRAATGSKSTTSPSRTGCACARRSPRPSRRAACSSSSTRCSRRTGASAGCSRAPSRCSTSAGVSRGGSAPRAT